MGEYKCRTNCDCTIKLMALLLKTMSHELVPLSEVVLSPLSQMWWRLRSAIWLILKAEGLGIPSCIHTLSPIKWEWVVNASNVQPERKRAIPAMHQMLPCYWSDNHRLCAVECQAGELSQFKGAGMQDGPSLAMRPLKRTESWNEKMAFASPSNISITCRTAAFAGCESPRRSEEPLLLRDNEASLDAH